LGIYFSTLMMDGVDELAADQGPSTDVENDRADLFHHCSYIGSPTAASTFQFHVTGL
jgi:hypothetical protein